MKNNLNEKVTDAKSATAYMKGLISNESAATKDCIQSILLCQKHGAEGNYYNYIKNMLIEKIAKGPDIPNTEDLKEIVKDAESAKAYMKGLISNKSATAQDCIQSILLCQKHRAKGDYSYHYIKNDFIERIAQGSDIPNTEKLKQTVIDADSATAYMKGLISNESATAKDCIQSILLCQKHGAKGKNYKDTKAQMREKIKKYNPKAVAEARAKLQVTGKGVDTPKGLSVAFSRRSKAALSKIRNKISNRK